MADDNWGMDEYNALTSQFQDMNHGNPYYVPTLHYDHNWDKAHSITGKDFINPQSSAGDPPKGDPPDPGEVFFTVVPADIRDRVSELISTLKTSTQAHEDLQAFFKGVEDWVFLAPTKADAVNFAHLRNEGDVPVYSFNSIDDVKDLITGVELGIAGLGNAIETASQFAARLNDAAQAYAQADQHAFGKGK